MSKKLPTTKRTSKARADSLQRLIRHQPLNQAEIVFVEWVDSTTTFGWREPDKDGPSVITSVGILVHHDAKNVVISTSRSNAGRYVDQLTIPRSCIRKMHGETMRRP